MKWPLALGLLATRAIASAEEEPWSETALAPIVVSATRVPAELDDVAASLDVVDGATLRRMGPLINLSEGLQRVPGLSVLNRQNLAQDLQISSRGFGSRSAFGVRGVRLYADGIPATMPDGQGQSALFDLGSAERIEVLRGPASALYGNASGGVIQVFTEEGPPRPEATAGLTLGRDRLHREQVKVGGQAGQLNYVVNATRFQTEGYRDHSAAQRDQFNARLKWAWSDHRSLTVVGSYLNMPEVQDPLGLTASQWRQAPASVARPALDYNTRKNIENGQMGAVYEQRVRTEDTLRVMAYAGSRQVRQFQSIPKAVQSVPETQARHPGGVIDFSRHHAGLDVRYTWRHLWWSRPLELTGGVNLDRMGEQRQGYQNFMGDTLGVVGALRRDEDNTSRNSDQYIQGQWTLSDQWALGVGWHHSRVRFESRDQYIVSGNGDDSGSALYTATTPTVSLMFKASPRWRWYVSAGRSFETPTLNEVAYRSIDGSLAGMNLSLRPSTAEHVELGMKARPFKGLLLNAALFRVSTQDEIGVNQSAGGRTTYRNVGRTLRQGLEASTQWRLARAWTAYAAASLTDAHYRDTFGSGAGQVAAGNQLPGVPERTVYAELAWRPSAAWQSALEMRHSARLWANDVNTEYAPAYTLWAWRAGWARHWGDWRLDALVRVDNLGNQRHVGSVIVNEGNARYFEPAPGRSVMVSTSLTRRF